MIYAFTGKTGSGKTFNMVRHAYKRWRSGTDIYSNTILDFERHGQISFFEKAFWKLMPDTLKNKLGHPTGPERGRITYFEDISEILEAKNGLILFDEAQVLFSARNWENLPYEFSYKLQQHRKHRLDLFCTTQNMGTIDINYRRLVQKWFHHEVVAQIGAVWFGIFRIKEKDVDYLYNSVDDLTVPDIKAKLFIIHKWKTRLYDTYYDIGFKRFKTIWITSYNKDLEKVSRWMIVPKEMSLSNAQKEISLLNSASGRSKFPNSKANSKTYATNT